MKIQHLRFFCAVVESRSVTAASQRLHISQPAISAGLKALEQEMGQPLFDRSGGKQRIVPTPAALRFYEDAKDILGRCETARKGFSNAEPRPRALRVGILRTLACGDVAAVVARAMLGSDPAWKIREGTSSEIASWLAQDRIDIAWTTIERPNARSEVLWHEPFAVLMARHHRLAQRSGRGVAVADLADEAVILRTSCELRSGKLQAAGVRLRIVARASRDDLALKLIAQNIGIAVAPRSFATSDVIAIPFADLDLTRAVGLRWRAGLAESHVRPVREIVSQLGKPPDWP